RLVIAAALTAVLPRPLHLHRDYGSRIDDDRGGTAISRLLVVLFVIVEQILGRFVGQLHPRPFPPFRSCA
ncbi:hypothetical protein PENTCL1PPCAC_25131, partial [Pristionchus entomophagus]